MRRTFLAFGLASCLGIGVAEDLVTFTNGATVRCRVAGYAEGMVTLVDQKGQRKTGQITAVQKIDFDVPPDPGAPPQATDTPSIEKLRAFPSRYVGRTLTFAGCEVSQRVERLETGGLFGLPVTSKGGEYVVPILNRDGLCFAVSTSLAEKLANRIEGGYVWPSCTIRCKLESVQRDGLDDVYYVARVLRLDIYNAGGKLSRTFTE